MNCPKFAALIVAMPAATMGGISYAGAIVIPIGSITISLSGLAVAAR